MSRGHFIGLHHHRLMLADAERMRAYQQAIAARVRPGQRVLDLGTGTGVLAMWAAQAGAEVVASGRRLPVLTVVVRSVNSRS